MVNGIESFREKFGNYSDCYTVIGGAACDILMTDADLNFRATKDIDMILVLEDKYQEFASVFWEFIREGGYPLYLYLYYMKDVSKVTDTLHIHRSTLFYRLAKIRDMLHIDFDSGYDIEKLLFH